MYHGMKMCIMPHRQEDNTKKLSRIIKYQQKYWALDKACRYTVFWDGISGIPAVDQHEAIRSIIPWWRTVWTYQ